MQKFTRIEADVLQRIGRFPTAALSDALDRHGILGAVEGLKPLVPGRRVVGQAITLAYLPVGNSGGTVGDFLHEVQAGDIIAIDNHGRTDCTVWGGILSRAALKHGVAATIINGACRDSDVTREVEFPMWVSTPHMLTGKDRVALQAINVPIALGKVRVEPGDVLVADGDGVVCIPLGLIDSVLKVAARVDEVEAQIVKDVMAGMPLAQARQEHAYFSLQRLEVER